MTHVAASVGLGRSKNASQALRAFAVQESARQSLQARALVTRLASVSRHGDLAKFALCLRIPLACDRGNRHVS